MKSPHLEGSLCRCLPVHQTSIFALISFCSLLFTVACGGIGTNFAGSSNRPASIIYRGGEPVGNRPSGIPITISVFPGSAALQPNQSLQFTAALSGTINTKVVWISSLGHISSSGVYTAPSVPSQTPDTIVAISTADPTKRAGATVVVADTPPSVTISVSPGSVALEPGQSTKFTAAVSGTSNSNVTWSALLGHISSSGLYTAPANQTADTVSATSGADPTKYATSSVTISTNAPWTATHQQPVTMEFYPGSIWTTPLPANPALLTNSDAIVQNVYQSSDFPGGPVSCLSTTPGATTCDEQKVFYYSSETDPIYLVTSCSNVPRQGANNPAGKYFHLTNRAPFSSYNNDQMFTDWDQSLDIDSTPGGRILSFYTFCASGKCPLTLPSCTCTTTSCANVTASCQIQQNWCDMGYPQNDAQTPRAVGNGVAWINVGAASGAGFLRDSELEEGTINHAIFVTTACVGGSSFPSNTGAMLCADSTNAINNGALVYVDSSYNCSSLPGWQKPVCVALQTYGGYVAATTGGNYSGLGMNAIEGQIAQHLAGASDPTPFFSYLSGFSSSDYAQGVYCTGSPVTRCNVYPVQNMPGLITGDSANGYKPHLHVADPCVPKTMAGIKAACTGSPGD